MATDAQQRLKDVATPKISAAYDSAGLVAPSQESTETENSTCAHFLASYARDLVFELDEKLNYRFASTSHEPLLGLTPEQLLGYSFAAHVAENDLPIFHYHTGNEAPETSTFSLRLKHRDGYFCRFEGAIMRHPNGFWVTCHVTSRRERLEAEIDTLTAIGREVNVQRGIDDLITCISGLLRPLIAFDRFFITFIEGDVLRQVATDSPGIVAFNPVSRSTTPGHPIWNRIDAGVMWSETDVRHIEGFPEGMGPSEEYPTRAFINVPLLIEGAPIGILHFDSHQTRIWNEAELRLARLASVQLAAVIQGSQLLRERQQQGMELAQSNALLRAIQEAAAEGICLVSGAGELISYNRRFAELWHLENESHPLENGQIMMHILSKLADPDEFIHKITDLFEARDLTTQDEIVLADGRIFARYSAPASDDQGQSYGRIWTFSDITQRKNYESQLAYQAFHDAVTGLPNRVLFVNHLERALSKIERSRTKVAVLFLDLDRFKIVNDSLGHERGDQLLVQVADRIRHSLRPGDVAARFGGDEFMVLLEDVGAPDDATSIADRIAANLKTPFTLGNHEVAVTASIGIVLSNPRAEGQPNDGADDLLRKADVAMYRAKNKGKAQYELFSEKLSAETLGQLQLEIDLSKAIKNEELTVYYQPLVNLKTGEIRAFEALVRWQHPARGLVAPGYFIPIAEETGQIVAIGEFVLREACQQAKTWSETLGEPVLMHVNVSSRQFEQASLPSEIERILCESGLPAPQLMLEITESAVMTDATSAVAQLKELKKLGVAISIDDFGTGYSSLAYLEFFPIDLLKIDRTFVSRLGEGTVLVRAIASLGHAIGIEIAAEGIENTNQLAQLREMGVQWGQGFLISKPVPAAQAESLLHITF